MCPSSSISRETVMREGREGADKSVVGRIWDKRFWAGLPPSTYTMAIENRPMGMAGIRGPQQVLALLFGAVLAAVGAVGFVPELVSEGNLLGIFGVNPLHNVVHLATGALGLYLGLHAGGGTMFNRLGGVGYLLVAVVGTVALALGFDLFINLNWADNALHLALGVVVTGVGFSVGRT